MTEHLICEFCRAEFNALGAYQEHKARNHAQEEAALQHVLDEQSAGSFPASDTPSITNPTVRTGEACKYPLLAAR
ncbi:MAG: hypothetical protein M0R73_04765 [Dehalococcoidia bacterium]|nr:hypothetical protein [Dehalococcoidia bacterium]